MYEEKDARETNVLSLRLPSERIEHLRKEASSRKVSLNVLANHILDAYFDFALPAKNVGFITLPKKTLRDMLALLNEAQLSKLAQGQLKSEFVDLVYMLKGKFTLQSYLNTFLAWARDSNFTYRDSYEGNIRTITLHHNMGKKWSFLLCESISSMIKDIAMDAKFEVRDDVLVLRFKQDA